MATYVLIPGAGGQAWYWHRLAPLLRDRGHVVVAVDLPGDDDRAGLSEYADVVQDAIGDRIGLVVGDWWEVTGFASARAAQAERDGRSLDDDPDLVDAFFHDVPADVTAAAMRRGAPEQSGTPFALPWPLARWPDVPTRVLQARDDRFFPVDYQRAIAEERLGITPDEMPGGHLVALSRPAELAERLEAYRLGLDS